MKFVILTGSERAGGNTDEVARQAALMVEEQGGTATVLALRDYEIAPCGSCGDCNWRNEHCARDDGAPTIVAQMIEADAILYIAPVHGFGMPHLMQIFIERAGVGYLRFTRPLANKVGGVVVTGRRYNHGAVGDQLVNNMLLNRMILVGSGYPVHFHGGRPGEALDDREAMAALRGLVERMAGMVLVLQHAAEAGMDHPLRVLEPANERGAPAVPDRERQ